MLVRRSETLLHPVAMLASLDHCSLPIFLHSLVTQFSTSSDSIKVESIYYRRRVITKLQSQAASPGFHNPDNVFKLFYWQIHQFMKDRYKMTRIFDIRKVRKELLDRGFTAPFFSAGH